MAYAKSRYSRRGRSPRRSRYPRRSGRLVRYPASHTIITIASGGSVGITLTPSPGADQFNQLFLQGSRILYIDGTFTVLPPAGENSHWRWGIYTGIAALPDLNNINDAGKFRYFGARSFHRDSDGGAQQFTLPIPRRVYLPALQSGADQSQLRVLREDSGGTNGSVAFSGRITLWVP